MYLDSVKKLQIVLIIEIEKIVLVGDCELASCEMIKYTSLPQVATKMVIGTANITSCIFFFYVLKSTMSAFTSSSSSHHNTVRS